MVIQSEGQFDPARTDVEQAGQMLQTMEGILGTRRGHSVAEVRPSIARTLKTTVGTIVNDGLARAVGAAPPVDRTQRALTDGSPVTPDHRELRPDGMQKAYVVLSEEERKRGFVRPVRRTYVHQKCGGATTMGLALAETYARDPRFYSGTYCVGCGTHFPVGTDGEFVWDDGTKVGT